MKSSSYLANDNLLKQIVFNPLNVKKVRFLSNLFKESASKHYKTKEHSEMRHLALLLISILSFAGTSIGQSVCLGNDTSVCVGSSVTIQDCNPGQAQSGLGLPNPTYVNLSDDSWSGAVNIGFTTNFYGQNYTQCVIGSNGLISFNLSNANGYCPWSLAGVGALPQGGFAAAKNAQMPAYMDIHPGIGGSIFYKTIGTAPNRSFVVVWENIPAYGVTNSCVNMGLIIHETSNKIEFHVGYKPLTPTWNSGLGFQGVENAAGTVAHMTPGRNNTAWSAFNDAREYTPTAPNNTNAYTISVIPYWNIYNSTAGGTFQWASTTGQTFPYNNGNLVVNNVQANPIGYFLSANSPVACSNNPVSANSDTTWISGLVSSVTASGIDDICSSSIGEVTANPQGLIPPYTYNWPTLGGATTQTVTGVAAGSYQVEMWDGNGCMSTATVVIGDTPAAFQGTTTVVSCPGGNDGTATAEMVPLLGTVTYQWDDPMNQTTQTATGLTAGTYTCTITSTVGCQGTVTLDVTEIPGMIGIVDNTTDATCNSGSDGTMLVTVNQGTPPYSYSWDNSSSTTNFADDLSAGVHTVTVTDANGCIITISGVIGEPPALDITFITPDTQICPEDEITLTATGTGGSSPYTFTWYQGGTQLGTGASITVDPEFTNTTYCVELSEACGSPTDQECTMIYFPTPIEPMAVPLHPELCVPDTFVFFNTSTNGGEIATTFWEFGDNITHNAVENGTDSTSHFYNIVGTYDITMTVTSIYGCVYSDTMENLITVLSSPTADFTFSSNPTTMFETEVILQDRSTHDVVDWQWYSPYSSPTTSSITTPTFMFPDGVTGNYPITLIVTTEHGCIDTVVMYLSVVEDILFYAPNAFTPDGDEFNQTWNFYVQGIDIYDFELQIFNRWGEIVWETLDPSAGWDGTYNGKVVQAGTYQWKAIVKNPLKDERRVFTGSVSILK